VIDRQTDGRIEGHADGWTLVSIIYGANHCLQDGSTCRRNPENDIPVFDLFALR
jgi:hypothetical protein